MCILLPCHDLPFSFQEALELMADKSEFDNCDCGCYERLAFASSIAQDLRIKLQNQLGLTSCAGIAHSKILAKLIGSIHKPNQQTTIFPEFAEHYLLSLPVGKIPGILCFIDLICFCFINAASFGNCSTQPIPYAIWSIVLFKI